MKITCQQCGRIQPETEICRGCNAFVEKDTNSHYRSPNYEGYSYYNGYVVWCLDDYGTMNMTWQFWLGDQMVEEIALSYDVIQQFVKEGESVMPLVWDLFKITQGEEKVLRIQAQNIMGRPAHFEVRYAPTKREEWLNSLTMREMVEAAREGRREWK